MTMLSYGLLSLLELRLNQMQAKNMAKCYYILTLFVSYRGHVFPQCIFNNELFCYFQLDLYIMITSILLYSVSRRCVSTFLHNIWINFTKIHSICNTATHHPLVPQLIITLQMLIFSVFIIISTLFLH